MKYLYPYEREKEALSTQEQLQTAIETNRRESRRNNYGYNTNNDSLVPRNQHNSMPPTSLPMLSIAQITAASESQHHVVNGHPQAQQHLPQHLPNPMAQVSNHGKFFCLSRSGNLFALCKFYMQNNQKNSYYVKRII